MRALRFLLRLTLGLLALAVVGGAGAAFLVYHSFGRDLPDIHQLATYSPPTVTRVHAADGRLLAEYARERRIFVPVAAIPDRVKQAFISAEDQHFYEHPGVDVLGILRASFSNLERLEFEPPPGGRFHHHPAGREELPAQQRAVDRPEDQGGDPGAQDRAGLQQGPDP